MASVESVPPYGDYHGMTSADGERYRTVLQTTRGTTGVPQPLFFGARDREVQNFPSRSRLSTAGSATERCSALYIRFWNDQRRSLYSRSNSSPYRGPVAIGPGTGVETRSRQQVELMHRFGATVLVGFADYMLRLAQTASDTGLVPGTGIPLRMISGHLGQDVRDKLSDAWGGVFWVFDWYGVGDTGIIAAEGPSQEGLYVWEDAHFVEIVTPGSGKTSRAW
ncbi:MAG: hypothetical protein Ct9H300mP14_10530 [Gammaproteobacteria bacterium]|nr:MAG: hypothetical protein Ct9H300mP14_10530 [Gammaproteobacteria bacterium]